MPVDQSLYADAEAPAAPEAEPQEEMQSEGGATAEIPRSVLGGKEFAPGDEIVLRVVQLNEDSVVVEYASGEEEEEAPPMEEEAPPPAAAPAGGMAEMME